MQEKPRKTCNISQKPQKAIGSPELCFNPKEEEDNS